MHKTFEVRWEGDLPGTPEQIWDAFTKDTAGWMWPVSYEPRVGGAERGLTSKGGTVTAWEPQQHFATSAGAPGAINALDYRLDGTRLAFEHRSDIDAAEFDVQHDACKVHTRFYYHSLGAYLGHFAGREADYRSFDAVPGSTPEVLERLGIPAGAAAGDEVELGVVDYRDDTMVGVRAENALIRVYGRDRWGWPVGVAVHAFDGSADESVWRKRLEVA